MRSTTATSLTSAAATPIAPVVSTSWTRRLVVAGLAALFCIIPTTVEADASSNISGCSYASARVLGWVWADGKYRSATDDFFFRTKSGAVARHLETNLNDLGVDYRQGTSKQGHDRFRIVLPGYDASFMTTDPLTHPAISCDPSAFLASVIEAEANKNGLIMDDPKSERRNAIIDVLNRVNIDATDNGFKIRADRNDWPVLRTLPFVSCYRVPGGSGNCVQGQAQ